MCVARDKSKPHELCRSIGAISFKNIRYTRRHERTFVAKIVDADDDDIWVVVWIGWGAIAESESRARRDKDSYTCRVESRWIHVAREPIKIDMVDDGWRFHLIERREQEQQMPASQPASRGICCF